MISLQKGSGTDYSYFAWSTRQIQIGVCAIRHDSLHATQCTVIHNRLCIFCCSCAALSKRVISSFHTSNWPWRELLYSNWYSYLEKGLEKNKTKKSECDESRTWAPIILSLSPESLCTFTTPVTLFTANSEIVYLSIILILSTFYEREITQTSDDNLIIKLYRLPYGNSEWWTLPLQPAIPRSSPVTLRERF